MRRARASSRSLLAASRVAATRLAVPRSTRALPGPRHRGGAAARRALASTRRARFVWFVARLGRSRRCCSALVRALGTDRAPDRGARCSGSPSGVCELPAARRLVRDRASGLAAQLARRRPSRLQARRTSLPRSSPSVAAALARSRERAPHGHRPSSRRSSRSARCSTSLARGPAGARLGARSTRSRPMRSARSPTQTGVLTGARAPRRRTRTRTRNAIAPGRSRRRSRRSRPSLHVLHGLNDGTLASVFVLVLLARAAA